MQKQYLVFLVKREESRDLDVFFWSVFGCLEERKNVEWNWTKKKCASSLSDGCWGLFIAPSAKFEAAALKGPPTSNLL